VNGAVIDAEHGGTSDLPSVEEVFGLLSQVLNGSDLADLQTINVEVSKALAGREQAVRGALTQLNTFVSGLNAQKQQIVRALDELNRFTGALKAQDSTIATALTDLGPGLRVLADEQTQFTSLLQDLSKFGHVATHVINASKTQTIQGLADLQPVLHHLAAAGKGLPRSLEILLTFPFPRDSSQASPGDYTNFQAALNVQPILCEAFADLDASAIQAILNTTPLLGQLGLSTDCPGTSNTLTKKNKKSGTSGTSTTTGGATTNGGTGAQSTTGGASSSSGSLAQLLEGLLGGGSR
jgi:phospholipid/cholesterol/gamma-HCH transport system substrate-binding protein